MRSVSTAAHLDAEYTDPEELLRQGVALCASLSPAPVGLACSFSVEDLVLWGMIHRQGLKVRVFALDTGRLPEETFQVAAAAAARFEQPIEWLFPDHVAVEALVRRRGPYSFRGSLEERHECCHVRKVAPLNRALSGLSGWITGQRREQSVTRSDLMPIERDEAHGGILKLNPLCYLSEAQVWDYAREHRLPMHPLYEQGYTSIGCAPCTRATQPGEHPRAGRWWWEAPEHKECGLHRR